MTRCAVSALWLVFFALGVRSSAQDGEIYRLGVPARAGEGEGPLDWVYERVATSGDSWSGERSSDEVKATLDKISGWLVEGKVPPAALAELLAPGFRAAPLLPAAGKETVGSGGSWRSLRSTGEPGVAAAKTEEFEKELLRLGAACGRVSKAHFKIFRVSAGKESIRTDVLLELDGVSDKGEFSQVRTTWRMEWTGAGQVRLKTLGRVEFEKVSMAGRAFTDSTIECLGADPVFNRQLSRGVGYWRTRIDASSGMDVYGHQGIAVGDFDGDGWLDFHVPQPAGLPNRLYRNLGNGTFSEVARAAGVDVLDGTGGSLFVDLDNDSDADLVVVTSLEVLLFENDGKGRFRRGAGSGLEKAGRRSASTIGCAAADYDLDGDLDLYIFSYVFWAGAGSKLQSTYPYPYHDANNGAPNFLFRNEGKLRFRDVTEASGMSVNNQRFSLAASWCDFDADGDPDLYVANDFGRNNLFLNEGGGRFREVAQKLGVDDVGNGMSVTWEDFDNDGRIDLYVGNMWSSAGSRIAGQPEFQAVGLRETYRRMSRGNSLFRNAGGGASRMSACSPAPSSAAGPGRDSSWTWREMGTRISMLSTGSSPTRTRMICEASSGGRSCREPLVSRATCHGTRAPGRPSTGSSGPAGPGRASSAAAFLQEWGRKDS